LKYVSKKRRKEIAAWLGGEPGGVPVVKTVEGKVSEQRHQPGEQSAKRAEPDHVDEVRLFELLRKNKGRHHPARRHSRSTSKKEH
jgi:hypothetical protein